MNPIFPLFTIASLYTTPVQQIAPQVYYISNLSETDGAKCGEYITITPQFTQQPEYRVTPQVIIEKDDEVEGE
jgi:hypothetical protein